MLMRSTIISIISAALLISMASPSSACEGGDDSVQARCSSEFVWGKDRGQKQAERRYITAGQLQKIFESQKNGGQFSLYGKTFWVKKMRWDFEKCKDPYWVLEARRIIDETTQSCYVSVREVAD